MSRTVIAAIAALLAATGPCGHASTRGADAATAFPAADVLPPPPASRPAAADTARADTLTLPAAADSLAKGAPTLHARPDTTQAARPDTTDDMDNPLYAPLATPELIINEDSLAEAFRRSLDEKRRWLDDDAAAFDPNTDPYFARFNPSPNRAVWYAALFPGGGQIYNRKYWKLPIIYGGFLGLIYGYQWNARYYRTYSNAYRDLVLGSPNASYRDFLPPNYPIEARHDYLEKVFKRKKNSYRNYRDYCVVGMIGVYLVSMIDAYVDASLYHFDVSPELGPDDKPALMLGYTVEF